MGISHLHKHAGAARRSQQNSGAPDAVQIQTPLSTRPAAGSAANDPKPFGAVTAQTRRALHPGTSAAQPAHGGARAGAKSGNGKLGMKGATPGMSGGRLN